jgi:predicted ArsR family transcriptional regulator
MTSVPLILQREIEAKMAVALINRYAQTIGRDEAFAVAEATIRDMAEQAGRSMAGRLGSNRLEDLARVVREVWSREEALGITFTETSQDRLAFDVHRCRYAELYERLGIRNLGAILSCGRDAAFSRGFNASIRMERTRTIMEGANYCDFRFFLT